MTGTVSTLPDKLAETRRRITELEAKAEQLRQKLIALGQSTVTGERYIATIRTTAVHDLDPDKLRKRISEDQLRRCMIVVQHVIVTTHERDGDD